jgi:hypothetical protein
MLLKAAQEKRSDNALFSVLSLINLRGNVSLARWQLAGEEIVAFGLCIGVDGG